MPVARLDGLDVYWERRGEGEPLLFISGTGGDLRVKPNVLDGPLAKAFDVLAYDQRAWGRRQSRTGPIRWPNTPMTPRR